MSEKPIECSHCKRQSCILYKEVSTQSETAFEMCLQCPVLEQKLSGSSHQFEKEELSCPACHTSMTAIRTGEDVGCPECYQVFASLLAKGLQEADSIPKELIQTLKLEPQAPLHLGKTVQATTNTALSSKLTTLHQSLETALKQENYEQAAWLRDQIKLLMDHPHGSS